MSFVARTAEDMLCCVAQTVFIKIIQKEKCCTYVPTILNVIHTLEFRRERINLWERLPINVSGN